MRKKYILFLAIILFVVMAVNVASYELAWADESTVGGQNNADKTIETVEEKMDFLYIESSELESPGTQNIAVAWDKDMGNVTGFVLVYSDTEGTTYELKESARAEKSVLFAKKFSSEEVGTYTIRGMKYFVEGSEEEQFFEFKDVEIKADFEVVNKQSDSVLEVVDTNVASSSLDTQEQTSNVQALLATANVEPRVNTRENVVVVIDPGHGGDDPGTCHYGLKEKDINLKIGKYLRDELKEYSGVEVYMTRETDKHLETATASGITNRVNYAKGKNADLLVSVHINAVGGRGAEVWAPNENYRSDIYEEGQGVSQEILDELVALGLYNRGVKESYSRNNTQYPDKSLADYYGIIRQSKEAGFVGIIVEHAFLDNASDAAFLSKEENLKKLGIADATGIANYYGLKKEPVVDIEDGTYTINSLNSDFRLAVINNSLDNKKGITTVEKSSEINSAQRFEVIKTNRYEYKILLEHSGKALDVQNAVTSVGALVQQYEWNGTDAQKWYFVDTEENNNSYYIRSKLGTYLTVDVTGNMVETTTKENAHKWTIEKSEVRYIDNGIYSIANKTNNIMTLDISGASMKNNGNVQIYKSNGTLAQKLDIKYVGGGYYKITAVHSNKALDVFNAQEKTGANLQQYTYNGSNAQLWKFIDAGDGYYYIKSKLGTVVAPASKNMKNGTNVEMEVLEGSNSQKWMLEDLSRVLIDDVYLVLSDKDSLRAMTSKNGNAQINIYENIEEQKYYIEYVSNGFYRITNKASGKSLEVVGSSNNVMANLGEGDWGNYDNQLWQILEVGENRYCLKSKLGTFIDISSGSMAENNKIWMYSYNGTEAQIWKFDNKRNDQSINPIKDGAYIIESALKTNRVMDIFGGSLANAANVQLYESNDTAAQRFVVNYVGDGYYNIVNEKSGKAIDVANGSNKAGANLWQYTCNGTDAQKWKFIDAGNGYYYIKSPKGTVIDVKSAMTWNGTNIWMYTLNGSNAQKWKLKKCEQTGIMGTSNVTSDELAAYYNSKNKEYPYSDNADAPTIKEFAEIYIDECNVEGVRADVAFCQAMKETGWLQFGGDVKASQYNFAGIGATGNGNQGNEFSDIRIGIRAHVQHLKAYACEDVLIGECVDPRFSYVKRGVSPYVEWLGQKENPWGKGWATAAGYGTSIVKMLKEI